MTLEQIEEIHQPIDAHYFTEDGSRETTIEVCAFCDLEPGREYAAMFPCEILEDARYECEDSDDEA